MLAVLLLPTKESGMLHKLLQDGKEVISNIPAGRFVRNFKRKMTTFQIWFVFWILVTSVNTYHDIMVRSGFLRVLNWFYYPRILSENDRSNLFVAAFVTFLFLNGGIILLFSLFMYTNWFFFFMVQSFFFTILLFNIDYMKKWVRDEDGPRPDKQFTGYTSVTEPCRPIVRYSRTILFLLYGEFQKLFIGIFWFLVILLMYIVPVYLKL